MVSSISTLSIFILVLISGYFTLPIDNDFTPETSFNTRTIFGDDIDTTQINEIKRSVDEHIGFDVFATTVESQPTEHKERIFEDSFTTEEPSTKRTVEDLSMVTVEPSEHKERMFEESFTFEPTTEDSMKKREFELKDTTATFSTEADKVSMPLFTSTSSAVAPELYVHGSTDFSPLQMTTQKYVGSLVDDEEHETEDLHDNSDRKHQTEEEVEKPKHTKSKSKIEDDEEVKGHQYEEEKPKTKLTKSKGKKQSIKEVEKEKPEDHLNEEELNNDKSEIKHKGEEEEQSRVEGKISKKPISSSSDDESIESTDDKKYIKAKLSDEDRTNVFPQTLNSRIAIYDSNDDVPSKSNKQIKTKLTQGKESSQIE